jgi:RNA polymerase sigma-70 factor (ECF subfamily)
VQRSVFRQLALDELDAVYRMAMHLSRHPDEAADLVQETYLKAFKAESRFELRERGIRPWLFKILHNSFYTRHAKRKHEPNVDQEFLQQQAGGNSEAASQPAWDLQHLDWEQVDDRLKQAIDALPDHQREVLLLWSVEGMKYREIADVLEVALGTVMSRLHRARATLSEQLAELAAEHGIKPDTAG